MRTGVAPAVNGDSVEVKSYVTHMQSGDCIESLGDSVENENDVSMTYWSYPGDFVEQANSRFSNSSSNSSLDRIPSDNGGKHGLKRDGS